MNTIDRPTRIENAFTKIIEAAGGERLLEHADYLFKNTGIVVELKVIDNDIFNSEERNKKVKKWLEANKNGAAIVQLGQKTLVDQDKLSLKQKKEFQNIYRKPVKGIIARANSQIKETKKTLGLPEDVPGVLVLINAASPILDPSHYRHYFTHLFNSGRFSQIDLVVCTIFDLYAYAPTMRGAFCFWDNWDIQGRRNVDKKILDNLWVGWNNWLVNEIDPTYIVEDITEYQYKFVDQIRLYREKQEGQPRTSDYIYE